MEDIPGVEVLIELILLVFDEEHDRPRRVPGEAGPDFHRHDRQLLLEPGREVEAPGATPHHDGDQVVGARDVAAG